MLRCDRARFRSIARWAVVALTAAASGTVALGQAGNQAVPKTPPVTFTKSVAPILQQSCQTCHRPGAIAPMSLMTYEETRPWARAIKARVTAREMPPWHIDRNIGVT